MSTLPPVRIAVLTPTFPTRAEPYRGLAIWSLLRELARRAELTAYCSLPHYYPHIGQHRDFIHDTPWLDSFAEVPAETLRFPAVPAPGEVARQSRGVPEGVKLILFAGRFVPLKGLPRLLDAFALLEPGKWFLALAGNGSEEPGLREKIHSLGLGSTVRFLGSLPPAEVARWMNAADLLCLPSESEGRPNVILEALGCGGPVVATPVAGIPALLHPACPPPLPPHHPARPP